VSASVGDVLPSRTLLRRVAVPIAAFGAVVVAGVTGFVALAGVSPIEATFWLFDPAAISIHGASETVKAYAIVVYTGLILAGLWAGETAVEAAFGGQIRQEVKRVQTDRQIEALEDHVIVCGYGIFGRTVARNLQRDDVGVVAIERDPDEFERIRTDDVLGIEGDARFASTLQQAGVERARALVAAIDDSNANIQIAIVASQLSPDLRVVARIGDEMYEDLARRAGADEVVIPEVITGAEVTETLAVDRAGPEYSRE
jgi:voltage-gated potassium channel Kch